MKYIAFENTYSGTDENGNGFVCIDGYPEDENAEGTVIAEVFMTMHGDIAVSWHHNAYRDDSVVLELIEDSKRRLYEQRSSSTYGELMEQLKTLRRLIKEEKRRYESMFKDADQKVLDQIVYHIEALEDEAARIQKTIWRYEDEMEDVFKKEKI